MTATSTTTLTVAIIDGHRLTDEGLRRVAEGCTSVVSLATEDRSFADVEARWAVLAPGLAIEDGGRVNGVREAIVECARRGVVVIATPAPRKAATFVCECLQGAAAATEFDVPGIAVHVVRDEQRPGSVAWLSDTGDVSGYGVLFAVGYAAAHGVGVEMIEPTGGLDIPRTPGAVDEALALAEQSGVPLERHTDPSPISRVLRDEHSLVVHPVLDAPGGFNLLHPGHLPHKAVASGSPAAVVELIERFPGDVVAVYDAVHLLHGQVPAARIAAAAALGMVTISGVGIAIAGPASAATATGNTAVVLVDGDARSVVDDVVSGLSFRAEEHHGGTSSLVVTNHSRHPVTLTVTGFHGHGGSQAVTLSHVIQPGSSYTFSAGGGVKHWGAGNVTAIDGVGTPALTVMTNGVHVPPPQVQVDQVVQSLQPQHPPVVNQGPGDITSVTDPNTPGHTTITAIDGPTLTTPGGGQGPVTGPGGVTTQVQGQVEAPMLTPQGPTPQEGPQGPTVTPPVQGQVEAPMLTPQVPTPQEGPQGPTVTPPVQGQVDAPTLTPQVPTPQDGPQGPTVTPPVQGQVDAPTLVPQVPTHQDGPQGPTVTPPVHAQVDAPTLVHNLEEPPLSTLAGGGGPVVAPPSVTTTVTGVTMEEPPLPTTTVVTDVGTPTGGQVTSTMPTQIGDPVSTVSTTDQGPGAVTPGGGSPGGQGMTIVRPPASTDGGGLIVQTPDGDHAPQGELAHTGANVALLGGVAAALLAAGAGLAALGRKKSGDV